MAQMTPRHVRFSSERRLRQNQRPLFYSRTSSAGESEGTIVSIKRGGLGKSRTMEALPRKT